VTKKAGDFSLLAKEHHTGTLSTVTCANGGCPLVTPALKDGKGMHLDLNLTKLRLDQLQEAIRTNQVSFPSQVPLFIKHDKGKSQCHVVLLYFVLGWTCDKIAKRYSVTRQHIWQIVSEWRRHAVKLGYLQVIPPADVFMLLRLARMAIRVRVVYGTEPCCGGSGLNARPRS
jgi:hypothetical protein